MRFAPTTLTQTTLGLAVIAAQQTITLAAARIACHPLGLLADLHGAVFVDGDGIAGIDRFQKLVTE